MKLSILSSLLLTSIVSAATIPITSTTQDTYNFIFPVSAQSIKGRTSPTNAELMKLGLPLAKPVKLYEALAKRLTPAPAQASTVPPAGTAARNYQFIGCANGLSFSNGRVYSVGTTSFQQTADECATRSQTDGPTPNNLVRFAIRSSTTANCYTRVTTFASVPCTAANFGIYEVIP